MSHHRIYLLSTTSHIAMACLHFALEHHAAMKAARLRKLMGVA